ncbi:MAG: hypothetical protein WKF86_00215 [Acidimicrobiales bacterium]
MTPAYRYRATLLRAIDADTFLLDVDLGFRIHVNQTIRLRGIDAPELSTEAGKAARRYVVDRFAAAADGIVVETYRDKQTFARWVADVWVDGEPLADLLRVAGHEKPAPRTEGV